MFKLDEPLNTNERYLHGINVRLEILIDLVSSVLEAYASKEDIVTENNTYEEVVVAEEIEEIDYSQFTVAELKLMLDNNNVTYTSKMNKAELIELLK